MILFGVNYIFHRIGHRGVMKEHMTPLTRSLRLFTPDEAAKELGLTMRGLRHLREIRAISYFKFGHRSIRYSREHLETFLKHREVRARDAR